jgi:hypothetical protein
MSWLLPSALAIAGVAALVAVALHFIARSRPLAEPLPTARFIPQRPVRARTRSFALSDLLILLIRLAAIAALGVAVAGPVFAAARGRVGRVVVVDRSRSVSNIAEVRDSARGLLRSGDVLVAFDSAAVIATSIDSLVRNTARGSMSSALAAATRSAALLAARNDSVELVVISPFTADELDAATSRIRAAWPGRVRVVRTAATPPDSAARRVESSAGASDAVVAGLSLMGVITPNAGLRLVRGRMTAADSAWARAGGRVVLHWPAADTSAEWRPRPSIDAIGGVASETGTILGRFPRLWLLDGPAVAHWSDGEPAAVEHPLGRGCVRDVGILLDPSSDLVLRTPFRRFVTGLLQPCGGPPVSAAVDSVSLRAFAGSGALARSDLLRDRGEESSRWTPILLLVAAALLLIELAVRRSEGRWA